MLQGLKIINGRKPDCHKDFQALILGNKRVAKGGRDPVSRTNFNKIYSGRTVLTKFHESRNST